MSNKRTKTFYIWNVLLFICAMICLVCYDLYRGLWLKGLTSSWFVLLGLVNFIYARKMKLEQSRSLVLIELGLFFGMCADVLLGVEFILGILFFALGHVFYLISFYSLEKFQRKDVLIIAPIAAVSLFVVIGTPFIRIEDPFMKKLLMGYAVIIACMLGKAISNVKKSTFRRLILLGSAMFWFSDLMLAINMFGDGGRITWILCSYTYWPAQNILALSLFHFVNENIQKDRAISIV